MTGCEILAKENKVVLVAGLDGTSQRVPFIANGLLNLIPLAEKVKKLSAICRDCRFRDAAFTIRLTDNLQKNLIGGAELYKPVCRGCYYQHENKLIASSPAPPLSTLESL